MLTINTTVLEKALLKIIDKREMLSKVTDEHERAEIKNSLISLEKDFKENYAEQLTDILEEVYDDLSPDSKVNPPLDYLAKNYKKISENGVGNVYDVAHNEGVPVDTDEYGDNPTKLVILPNPLRIILNIDEHTKEEVWSVNL